jgi:hypothetical protein
MTPARPSVGHFRSIDMFGGLSMIASCPGVDAGRSKLKDHDAEITAVRELYELWLESLQPPAPAKAES